MSNSIYNIRNYQPSDFKKFIQLMAKAEKLEPTGRLTSPQAITENLGRPNYSPEQDLFVIEIDGNIVGYMNMAPERAIERVILDCWIYPEHRRKGLATKLLNYATHRAKELGVKVAHANISQDNKTASRVLSKLGFKYVRRFLELRLDINKFGWKDIDLSALDCRHLQPGEEVKLTNIQNRAFADHWGYNPNTVEETTYWTNLNSFSPEDVVLTCDGDKFIGYCTTGITNKREASGKRKGDIYMMGTDPDYQGKGVGKRVLLAGLAHLKNKGVRVIELTVDSENKVAHTLYQSVGFEVQTSSLWYEKVID